MGPCILSIFQYISNKMQRYTLYLYLKNAIHVSGGTSTQRYTVYLYLKTAIHASGSTSTHNQEGIQLYLQHLVFVTPLLLSAAIVEELELV
jgi:hypothetical protein